MRYPWARERARVACIAGETLESGTKPSEPVDAGAGSGERSKSAPSRRGRCRTAKNDRAAATSATSSTLAPAQDDFVITPGKGETKFRFSFDPIAAWPDAADDDRWIAAAREFAEAMRAFGTGAAYLNFTPESDRVRDAFGDDKYARLVALKDRYDPANLFRLNQNIRPSPAAAPAVA